MRRTFTAALVVLLAALGLVACGSSSTHTTTTTKASTTASAVGSGCPAGTVVVTPGSTAPIPSGQRCYVTSKGISPHAPNFGAPPAGSPPPRKTSAEATVEQFDSIFNNSPDWAAAVAGYANGNPSWRTFPVFVARYPALVKTHHVLSIAVSQGQPADCADMEPGNFGPDYAVSFYYLDVHAGIWRPCYYAALGQWMPAIESNLQAAGIPRGNYRLWDASWTYHPGVTPGFDCTQWTDRALGINLDESTCLTSFYQSSTPPPPPPPKPKAWFKIFPNQTFKLDGVPPANEQATIRSYVANKCEQPVRRGVCVNDAAAIEQLRNRVWAVAHFTKPTAWSDNRYLGDRWHDLNLALSNKTPLLPSQMWLPKGYSATVNA